jgi:hypothetical protein
MARVAQAYFHFHTRLAEKEMRKFGREVDQAARRAALRNFETAVLINVQIEEGSLIGRVPYKAEAISIEAIDDLSSRISTFNLKALILGQSISGISFNPEAS